MNDKLNKKLAEWAGFKFEPIVPRMEFQGQICGLWRIPNTKDKPAYFQTDASLPNFPESLDACFKWLVPKLIAYQLNNYKGVSNHQAIVATNKVRGKLAIAETPALALCLAIEKLIDGGVR